MHKHNVPKQGQKWLELLRSPFLLNIFGYNQQQATKKFTGGKRPLHAGQCSPVALVLHPEAHSESQTSLSNIMQCKASSF